MKKVFKVIFIYLGVILLALAATVVFCAGFLFFYREGNIFGIQYINTNEVLYAKDNEDMSTLKTIEINSQSFDVIIRPNSDMDNLMGAMRNKVFGYAKKSKAQASFNLEYDEITKTAVFTSIQPKGWLNKKDAYIEVAIPRDMINKGLDLVVKTSKGDINVGGDKLLLLDDLMIQSSKGDVNISNIVLNNSVNVNIGSGTVYIDDKCTTVSSISSQISLGSGTVNFAKINKEKFKFDTVEIKSIKRGKIGIIKAEELITNGNINGGGRIEVGDVGIVDFASLDTDLYIRNIEGIANSAVEKSRISISGQGDIWIDKSESLLDVNGHNGDIYVNTSTEPVVLTSNHGDIKMDNALKLVSATTTYGNINVKFSDSALDYSVTNENRTIVATTKNGHIIVRGLQHGSIAATDKGRVSLEYDKVVGENSIVAKYGVVNIIVPNPSKINPTNEFAFNLKVASDVNCDIKVGVVGELGSFGAVDYTGSGYKEFNNIYNSGSSTSNNLKVTSTTGIIKIRSRDLANF